MTNSPEPDLAVQEARAARRLRRLFGIERTGRLARLPTETAWRLIARRGAVAAELSEIESRRRAAAVAASPELAAALDELAREVNLSRERGEARVAELGSELRARRGEGIVTGLRGDSGGTRLLGCG